MTRMRKARPADNDADVDSRYGLEPVFDPAARHGDAGLGDFVEVVCPYCGEPFETAIDLTGGSSTFIEDCQVCCQPIEFELQLTDDGAIESLGVRRAD